MGKGLAACLRRHRPIWALAAVMALFLAGVGAFGSGDAGWVLRHAYWLFVMTIGAAIVSFVLDLFHARGWLEERPLLKVATLSLVITFPQTLVVWTITNWLFDDPWRVSRLFPLFPSVLLVSVAFVALHQLIGRAPPMTHASPASADQPRFLKRIPARLRGGELYAVEAEDHYLRVHTSRGSDLIAMRLVDAVAELEGFEGAQVHRGWWVARNAVRHSVRRRGRAILILEGGLKAPVSRTYAPALRRERWF